LSPKDINSILGEDLEAVKELIHNRLSSQVGLLQQINQGLLANPGKLLRPSLCLFMARACGKPNEYSRLFAAAVEMLHNSTLLHDDVADESDTRRGVPTVMSTHGPVPAVLVGDFWLARTLDLLQESEHTEWGLRAFAKTLTDLSEGEMLQQEKAFSGNISEEDYFKIIYCKTASLFELSCTAAAKSVDAPPEFFSAASDYGKAVGMAYQIKDDILDYDGFDLGKPVGVDLQEGKITLPLLGALKGASNADEIRQMVLDIPSNPQNRQLIADFVKISGGVQYAQEVLRDYVSKAIDALSKLPPSKERDYLEQFARLNEMRTK
jgi:octaprenyl-diphosphate synthase